MSCWPGTISISAAFCWAFKSASETPDLLFVPNGSSVLWSSLMTFQMMSFSWNSLLQTGQRSFSPLYCSMYPFMQSSLNICVSKHGSAATLSPSLKSVRQIMHSDPFLNWLVKSWVIALPKPAPAALLVKDLLKLEAKLASPLCSRLAAPMILRVLLRWKSSPIW